MEIGLETHADLIPASDFFYLHFLSLCHNPIPARLKKSYTWWHTTTI